MTTHTDDPALAIGCHEAAVLGGTTLTAALDGLAEQAPELATYVLRREMGDLGAGAALEPRDWTLITLGVLAALGDTADQLGVYADAALHHGATETEIQDVVDLVHGYAGTPRAVTAARAIATRAPAAVATGRRELVVPLADHETGVVIDGADRSGPPVLLLHALCMDRHYWRAVTPTLARQARVVAYDLRAHGRARGGPTPQSLDQMADDTALLLDRLGIDRADVVGASYGGAVAQHVALRHPDRVRALGLVATGARSPRELLRERAAKAERDGMAAQVPESLARWFLPETVAHNTWGVRYARSRVLRMRVEDWAASWRTMADLDVLDRLGEVRVPSLVVSGAQDLSSDPGHMRELADALPDARFAPIDPGTHMAVLEQPGPVADALSAFRRELDRLES
jgi:3-oxoadipate enol-lactonase